jgi:phosphinothricin acetyltransferase
MIRPIRPADSPEICDLYNYYVTGTTVTFEEDTVSSGEMKHRIDEITERFPWFVFEKDGKVVAFAYAGPWKNRSAYRYTAESTVYVHKDFLGQGIGSFLYRRLIVDLREQGLHSVLGCIALPNPASQALHEKVGFNQVAHFPQVGFKFGSWIDVGYWELVL